MIIKVHAAKTFRKFVKLFQLVVCSVWIRKLFQNQTPSDRWLICLILDVLTYFPTIISDMQLQRCLVSPKKNENFKYFAGLYNSSNRFRYTFNSRTFSTWMMILLHNCMYQYFSNDRKSWTVHHPFNFQMLVNSIW